MFRGDPGICRIQVFREDPGIWGRDSGTVGLHGGDPGALERGLKCPRPCQGGTQACGGPKHPREETQACQDRGHPGTWGDTQVF